MARFVIRGGKKLTGRVRTGGAKNAVLPLMASAVLYDGTLTLANVPDLADVAVMADILRALGARVERTADRLTIHMSLIEDRIPAHLATRLRASVLLLGPLLARLGKATLPLPGGDLIGRRPITTHLRALVQMGARVRETKHGYRLTGQLRGADLYLEEASVTGTENILMAATLARGVTIIRHAAQEAHVQALAASLAAAGANVEAVGSSVLTVRGSSGRALGSKQILTVPPDDLDAGTFAVAALVTGGRVTIDPYPTAALRPLTEKLRQIGADVRVDERREEATIERGERRLKHFAVKVGPAPGFPTDLQPPMTVLATQAEGVSLIHDWMYERRFGYVEQLERLGAAITVCDPHRILVAGPTPLRGQRILSPDIRSGIAFVLAGLAAQGETIIDHAEIIDRGYVDLAPRLRALGAEITREAD